MDEVADPAEIASDCEGGRQEITVDAACLGDSFDLVALETVKVPLELSDRRRQRTRRQEGRERLDRIGELAILHDLKSYSRRAPVSVVLARLTLVTLDDHEWMLLERASASVPPPASAPAIGTDADYPDYISKVGHVRSEWLRHTGASLAYAATKDMEAVAARLGHTSTRMIDTVYVGLYDDASRAVADALDALVEASLEASDR